jgi:uncharacterized DUF497 family protein
MEFEWDPAKAGENLSRHEVSFNEAVTVFGDVLSSTVADPDHSAQEDRYITIGWSSRGCLLMVAYGAWRPDSDHQCSDVDPR